MTYIQVLPFLYTQLRIYILTQEFLGGFYETYQNVFNCECQLQKPSSGWNFSTTNQKLLWFWYSKQNWSRHKKGLENWSQKWFVNSIVNHFICSRSFCHFERCDIVMVFLLRAYAYFSWFLGFLVGIVNALAFPLKASIYYCVLLTLRCKMLLSMQT